MEWEKFMKLDQVNQLVYNEETGSIDRILIDEHLRQNEYDEDTLEALAVFLDQKQRFTSFGPDACRLVSETVANVEGIPTTEEFVNLRRDEPEAEDYKAYADLDGCWIEREVMQEQAVISDYSLTAFIQSLYMYMMNLCWEFSENVLIHMPNLDLILYVRAFKSSTTRCFVSNAHTHKGEQHDTFIHTKLTKIWMHYRLIQRYCYGEGMSSAILEREEPKFDYRQNISCVKINTLSSLMTKRIFKVCITDQLNEKIKLLNNAWEKRFEVEAGNTFYSSGQVLLDSSITVYHSLLNKARNKARNVYDKVTDAATQYASVPQNIVIDLVTKAKILPNMGQRCQIGDRVCRTTLRLRNLFSRKLHEAYADFSLICPYIYTPRYRLDSRHVAVVLGTIFDEEHTVQPNKRVQMAMISGVYDTKMQLIRVFVTFKSAERMAIELDESYDLQAEYDPSRESLRFVVLEAFNMQMSHRVESPMAILLKKLNMTNRHFETILNQMDEAFKTHIKDTFDEGNHDYTDCDQYRFDNYKGYSPEAMCIDEAHLVGYKPQVYETAIEEDPIGASFFASLSLRCNFFDKKIVSGMVKCERSTNNVVINFDDKVVSLPCGDVLPLSCRVLNGHRCVMSIYAFSSEIDYTVIKDGKVTKLMINNCFMNARTGRYIWSTDKNAINGRLYGVVKKNASIKCYRCGRLYWDKELACICCS